MVDGEVVEDVVLSEARWVGRKISANIGFNPSNKFMPSCACTVDCGLLVDLKCQRSSMDSILRKYSLPESPLSFKISMSAPRLTIILEMRDGKTKSDGRCKISNKVQF